MFGLPAHPVSVADNVLCVFSAPKSKHQKRNAFVVGSAGTHGVVILLMYR